MKWIMSPLLFVLVGGLTGCPTSSPSLPATTSGGGFLIQTQSFKNGIYLNAPSVLLGWQWKEDLQGAEGDASPFNELTNTEGLGSSTNGRVNAQWTVTWINGIYPPECDGVQGVIEVDDAGDLVPVLCTVISGAGVGGAEAFPFSPNPFNTAAPPSSVTITGSGFISTYGMPVVQYFDMNGNLDAQQSATTVSSDGTTLTLATPNFTELAEGVYAGVISNIASDGSYSYVGTTAVDVPAPFYLPTAYSDMATGDPNDYNPTINPGGPTTALSDDAIVISSDVYSYDQNGNFVDTPYEGQCTWSGFPSHIDANNLTLYIPYYTMGSFVGSSAAYYTVTAMIGGSNVQLYAGVNGSGTLTANIPAGTDLSTIQVTVNALPENSPNGNPFTITDYFYLSIYVQ